jgi:hypothetical protein
MAIVQISKIKIRSGSINDLPQLDEGELGWASDERRLFIGNPPDPDNPGPQPWNTEIITQYSPAARSGGSTYPTGTTGQYLQLGAGNTVAWVDLPTYYVELIDNTGASQQIPVLSSGSTATASPPATATSAGSPGQIAYDSNYVYVCVAANTWKRASLGTW